MSLGLLALRSPESAQRRLAERLEQKRDIAHELANRQERLQELRVENCNLAALLLQEVNPEISWVELPDRHIRVIARSAFMKSGAEIDYVQMDQHLGTNNILSTWQLAYIPGNLPAGINLDSSGAKKYTQSLDQNKYTDLPYRVNLMLQNEQPSLT